MDNNEQTHDLEDVFEIMIDEGFGDNQVKEIENSDFFRDLQVNAQAMRQQEKVA
jgi:hypothetical protein